MSAFEHVVDLLHMTIDPLGVGDIRDCVRNPYDVLNRGVTNLNRAVTLGLKDQVRLGLTTVETRANHPVASAEGAGEADRLGELDFDPGGRSFLRREHS